MWQWNIQAVCQEHCIYLSVVFLHHFGKDQVCMWWCGVIREYFKTYFALRGLTVGETSASTSPAAGGPAPPHLQWFSKTSLQPCLKSASPVWSDLCFPLLYCSLAEYKLLIDNAGWKYTPSQLKSLEAYMRHICVRGHRKTALLENVVNT